MKRVYSIIPEGDENPYLKFEVRMQIEKVFPHFSKLREVARRKAKNFVKTILMLHDKVILTIYNNAMNCLPMLLSVRFRGSPILQLKVIDLYSRSCLKAKIDQ